MSFNFNEMFYSLERIGFGEVFIPFVLIFTILYSVLHSLKLFGGRKQFDVMISFIFAFLVVSLSITAQVPDSLNIVKMLNTIVPAMVGFIIAIVMFFIIIGAFGVDMNRGNLSGILVLLSAFVVLLIFGNAAGWFDRSVGFPEWLSFLNDPDIQMVLVAILVFGIIIWLVVREPTPNNKPANSFSKGLKSFFDFFGEKKT
ncbi:MAG TPA: hypothetical protein ENN46_03315 [Candidatus Woesearchaeota archaeon]|nr:hypothetical protein [Candidatus Woesearchaeota archaeon]